MAYRPLHVLSVGDGQAARCCRARGARLFIHVRQIARPEFAGVAHRTEVARPIRQPLRDRCGREPADSPPILLLLKLLCQDARVERESVQWRHRRRRLARPRRGQLELKIHLGSQPCVGPGMVEVKVGGSRAHGERRRGAMWQILVIWICTPTLEVPISASLLRQSRTRLLRRRAVVRRRLTASRHCVRGKSQ